MSRMAFNPLNLLRGRSCQDGEGPRINSAASLADEADSAYDRPGKFMQFQDFLSLQECNGDDMDDR